MAQTGYTPILIYASGTTGNTPSAGNLTSSSSGAELALNYFDGKLFYKDASGNVQVLATKDGATGNVVGPASATDNAIVRFDGTTGKLIQNSNATIDDTTGNINAGAYNKVTITAPATSATLTIANGKTLTANNSLTLSGTDGTVMTFPSSTTTVVGTDSTQTITNKAIQPRVVSIADATSITMNADTTDMATQANTQSAGTLTINAPTGTPVSGQKLMLRISSTSIQTFSWNAIFQGSTDLSLPTASTGSGKYDYVGFIYNAVAAKWQLLAKNFGF